MTRVKDGEHMRRALELAERGWGRVAPNPLVGAVVVRDGEVVGEGYHAEWGGPHAEVEALRAARDRTAGATLYVSLEPCHHTGKTGPCTQAIAEAGIARVVCGAAETNPDACGGAEWLRGQGLEVEVGVCETEARDLNAVHFSVISEGRPFVALKYALSIDARLSEDPGRPSRISSRRAIVEAHRLRAAHDALLVGIGTVLADDPRLTVREWRPPRRPPARVVLDSRLRLPPGSRLAQTAREAPVWACTAEDASAERAAALTGLGVEILHVRRKSATDGLDLRAVLAALWDRGVRSVLCEGGGQLGSALLAGGHVNRLYVFLAPRLFGEPGVAGFQGARGRAPREWRLVGRTELDEVTLLTLAPPLVSGEDAGTG